MMKELRYHPVAPGSSPRAVPSTGFGFDAIMANPDYTRFLDWWDANNRLAPNRAEVEAVFSAPAAQAMDEAA
jgi:hypothetical protein